MSDTTTEKPAKPEIRFAVTIIDGNRYGGPSEYRQFRAEAYVLGVDRYGSTGRPELLSCDEYSVPDREHTSALKGLVITAQSDNDHMKQPGDEWYAYEVGYDRPGTIKLKDAEEILPVLRKIRKRQEKLNAEFGFPRTLAQFCTYAVKAITSERQPFMRRVADGQDWEGHGYRSMDPARLDYHLSAEATEWRKNHNIDISD